MCEFSAKSLIFSSFFSLYTTDCLCSFVIHSGVLYYDTRLKWILCAAPYKGANSHRNRQIKVEVYA